MQQNDGSWGSVLPQVSSCSLHGKQRDWNKEKVGKSGYGMGGKEVMRGARRGRVD